MNPHTGDDPHLGILDTPFLSSIDSQRLAGASIPHQARLGHFVVIGLVFQMETGTQLVVIETFFG